MKYKMKITWAVLAAGMAWNLAGAAEPIKADPALESLKNEVAEMWKRSAQQPKDKDARIEFDKTLFDSCEATRQKLQKTPLQKDLCNYTLTNRLMFRTAERLYNETPTAENRKRLTAIAKESIAMPVHEPEMWTNTRGFNPASEVVGAAKTLAILDIYETPASTPKDAEKHIRNMIALFPDNPKKNCATDLHRQALVYGVQLAMQTGEKELVKELGSIVMKECIAVRGALKTLKEAGYPIPFEDETTLIDGRKISFPKDVVGKITVIDYWATWCGPCVASMPHIKAIHEKYKDRGVQVIGICCDAPAKGETPETCKKRVSEFLAKNNYDWTHVFNANWPASAVKYGVNGIPRVFVLDRQGNIVSDQARSQEERLIDQELAKDADKK